MSSQNSPSALSELCPAPQDLPCGMNDLPTEIKARIAELCAEQDERFKEKLAKASIPAVHKRNNRAKEYGRSVCALFEVSKEFSELAAPYLFQVLKASKADIHFKCAIATSPKRLSYFREVHFDTSKTTNLTDTISVLPRLIGATKLVFSTQALDAWWEYGSVSLQPHAHTGPAAYYAATALRQIPRIIELEFRDVVLHNVKQFVSAYATSLRTLCLTLFTGYQATEWLGTVLEAATNLENLCTSATGDYAPNRPPPVFTYAVPAKAPPLRSLDLSSNYLSFSAASFSALFSSTLEHLSLAAALTYEPSAAFPQPKFTSQVFPKLKHLTLSGPEILTFETLDSITPKRFPALETVELNFTFVGSWEGSDSPLYPFSTFPLLRTLRIPNLDSLSDKVVTAIETFCRKNRLVLEDASSAVDLTSSRAGTTGESRSARDIRTTLAYLEKQVNKAEKEGEFDELERIKGFVEGFEQERVRETIWEAV